MTTRRRLRGEGTIRQRPDGRWEARLPATLGQRPQSFYGKTEAEAAAKLRAALRRQARGERLVPDRTRLAQWLTTWLDTKHGLAPSTLVRYRQACEVQIAPTLGRIPLGQLTPLDIQRWITQQSATHAPSTVVVHVAVLRLALAAAVRLELIDRNPAQHVELPRRRKAQRQVLDPTPARVVLTQARGHRYEALFVLALTTGARIGELLALRWADVDLDARVLHIRRKALTLERERVEGPPKSTSGERTIPLAVIAVDALRRHQAQHPQALLFTTPEGKPLRSESVNNWHLRRLLEKAGLPRMRTHDLRGSFASLLRELGEPVEVIAALLGHADATMLLRTYRTLYEGETRRAVDRLGEALESE